MWDDFQKRFQQKNKNRCYFYVKLKWIEDIDFI